jgi:hypothetical protein
MTSFDPFASSSQLSQTENAIVHIMNAAATWGGAINDARRSSSAVTRARTMATMAVVDAIAKNPQHGLWGALATKVPVGHNQFLPAHTGAIGIPIVSFGAGDEREGQEADPIDIDAWRNDTRGLYTTVNGRIVPHYALDQNGMPSPVAGFYSIVNKRLKFTGAGCRVPMIQYKESDVAAKTPEFALATIVKLSIQYNLKEGDNLLPLGQALISSGESDLQAIEAGAMSVSPVSAIMEATKQL